jgi:hypothetical protein
VDLQLRDVLLEGNDTKNANNMQEMADIVGDVLEDATKKKMKMQFNLREPMEEVNVAQLTGAYMADGMHALRTDGAEKPEKRGQKTGRHINAATWTKISTVAKVRLVVEKRRGRRITLQALPLEHRLVHRCSFLLGLCCGLR